MVLKHKVTINELKLECLKEITNVLKFNSREGLSDDEQLFKSKLLKSKWKPIFKQYGYDFEKEFTML